MTIGKKWLFHFTDVRNIPSIKEHGLLSFAELNRRGISIPATGGNDMSHYLDNIIGLHEYVHLCFFNQHPMEYIARKENRVQNTVFLEINPSVLYFEGVRLTLEIATTKGVKFLTLAQALEEMDAEVICERTNWSDSTVQKRLQIARKYEVIIPSIIPIELIRGI